MMTQANDNKPIVKPIKYENLPTRERMAKGDFEIYDSGRGRNIPVARDKALLLIDKLRVPRKKDEAPILNEWQHLAGIQITTLYEITHANTTMTSKLSDVRVIGSSEAQALSRITATHRYNLTMQLMCGYQFAYWGLVAALCFETYRGMREACFAAQFRDTHTHVEHVRNAFDLLDDCLQEMRGRMDTLEKTFNHKGE